MDAMEIEIRNVTEELQFTNETYLPSFSGTYSSIHKATLDGQMVLKQTRHL
jgi:hypothetical protein